VAVLAVSGTATVSKETTAPLLDSTFKTYTGPANGGDSSRALRAAPNRRASRRISWDRSPIRPIRPIRLIRPIYRGRPRAHATGSRAQQPNADDRAIVGDPGAPGSHAELSDAQAPTTARLSATAQLDVMDVMDMQRNLWLARRRSPSKCRLSLSSTGSQQAAEARPRK
jgi:hypothetical protein